MLTEIDKDFYCSAGFYEPRKNKFGYCQMLKGECGKMCPSYHRKYPTPEQFKEEYGVEWKDGDAVYALHDGIDWIVTTLKEAKKRSVYDMGIGFCKSIVCACTPFGIPPQDWRLE